MLMNQNTNTNIFSGYIEGYYGKLLSWKSRKKIISKLSCSKMNTYFYAPKEDLYHRYKWRETYPISWQKKFKDFCHFAKSHNIRIIVGISPGLDFNFNSISDKLERTENDLSLLISKIDFFYSNGIENIVLMLDDIPNNFKKKFPDLNEGNIHANILNILTKHFGKEMSFVPRIYSDELLNECPSYFYNFFKTVKVNFNLFYCGKYIVSSEFSSKIKQIKNHKKITIWNNYYANDYCPNKLILGCWNFNYKNIMYNLTGFIKTDLLILDIINECIKNKNKHEGWKKAIIKNKVPLQFFKISNFFQKPTFSNEQEINQLHFDEEVINNIDFLLWNWKTNLAREWYPFLLRLKQDLQIFSGEMTFNRIMKSQTFPIQNIIFNRKAIQWKK